MIATETFPIRTTAKWTRIRPIAVALGVLGLKPPSKLIFKIKLNQCFIKYINLVITYNRK